MFEMHGFPCKFRYIEMIYIEHIVPEGKLRI